MMLQNDLNKRRLDIAMKRNEVLSNGTMQNVNINSDNCRAHNKVQSILPHPILSKGTVFRKK